MPNDVPDAVKVLQSIVGAVGVWLLGAIASRVRRRAQGVIGRGHRRGLSAARLDLRLRAERSALRDAGTRVRVVADAGAGRPAARRPGEAAWRAASSSAALLARPRRAHPARHAVLLSLRPPARLAHRDPLSPPPSSPGRLPSSCPWTARNAAVYGRFVLVASEGGVTFWTGNHREARGEGDLAANPHLKPLNREFRAAPSRADRGRARTDLLS